MDKRTENIIDHKIAVALTGIGLYLADLEGRLGQIMDDGSGDAALSVMQKIAAYMREARESIKKKEDE